MLNISSPIGSLNPIAKKNEKRFNKLGIKTLEDLLYFFPFRYDEYKAVGSIKDLKYGMDASLITTILLIKASRSPRKRMFITEALVGDETGTLKVVWFNQPFITKTLNSGDKISLAGRVDKDYSGLSMVAPVYEKLSAKKESGESKIIHTAGIVPNYHLTQGLTQKIVRFCTAKALENGLGNDDWIPDRIIRDENLPNLREAFSEIHFPTSWKSLKNARDRFAFEELFLLQLQMRRINTGTEKEKAVKVQYCDKQTKEFISSLPFELTAGQKRSAWEIIKDLGKADPMSRMLVGDVGSGKTVVALIALLNAIFGAHTVGTESGNVGDTVCRGGQAVFMAPTEILARQHFQSISKMLSSIKLDVALLTRTYSLVSRSKDDGSREVDVFSKSFLAKAIGKGEIGCIIGTHALLQETVDFRRLVLAIVDEQHRFGVMQRKALLEKYAKAGEQEYGGTIPHFLSMSATPIPRSLAMALYSDLEISRIDALPGGRKKIITRFVGEDKREAAYEFIGNEIKKGRQAFVICPLISESDKLGVKSVLEEAEKLKRDIFPHLEICVLHGKLKQSEKEKIMDDFSANRINMLVSTSVVEVGVDVPNATIMLIEGAERFGLSQLHQFRGRVGRGMHQSYCILFSTNKGEKTLKRLESLTRISDGFELAKIDLELRGPGELFGTQQKGYLDLKVANLLDLPMMEKAKKHADWAMVQDASLKTWNLLKIAVDSALQKYHGE